MKKNQIYQVLSSTIFKAFMFGIVIVHFSSCANIGVLTGGQKDTTPPGIDSTLSESNYRTNFTNRSFELVFDEWISIKDKSQIIVSPPLQFTPSITAKGKTVRFKLDERDTLKSNTTYVIQFGSSIVDFTEENEIKNYNYVFSTGNIIDSLTLKGNVRDAYSDDILEGVTVMLYDQYQDSIVYKERPYYVASTNKSGQFKFQNLRPGLFKIIALSDKNKNYLFNPGSDKIGFIDSLIRIDTFVNNLSISVFQEQLPTKFVDIIQPTVGYIKLVFNESAQEIDYAFSKSFDFQQITSGDTISIWHQLDSISELDLYVLNDTISIKDIRKEQNKFDNLLSKTPKEIHPLSEFTIPFNRPILSIDSSLFSIVDTAQQIMPFTAIIDSSQQNKLLIKSNWIEDQSYTLNLNPGAITDFYHNKNDSLKMEFNILNLTKFGSIIMNLTNIDTNYSHIVNLKLNETIKQTVFISKANTKYQYTFLNLIAGDYNFEIIEDKNEDNKWTSGNYLLKQQAETIKFIPAGKLRENWDLNVELSFKDNKEVPVSKETEEEVKVIKEKSHSEHK